MAYVAPSPVGATIPAFAISFILYWVLLLVVGKLFPRSGCVDPRDGDRFGHLLEGADKTSALRLGG